MVKKCKNCYTPLHEGDVFCRYCGQKYQANIPSLWELIKTAFEAIFNLDGRLWRSLRNLVVPGRLTEFYLAGRHKAYVHPFRLLLLSGALFVAALSFFIKHQFGLYLDQSIQQKTTAAYQKKITAQLEEQIGHLRAIYPSTDVKLATDSLLALYQSQEADTARISYFHYQGGLSFQQKRLDIDITEYHLLPPTEIAKKYAVEGTFNQYLVAQIIQANRSSSRNITQIIGQLIWGILLIIPLSSALLQLVYIRHKRKYVEHLIFSLHVHSFSFLMATVPLLLSSANIADSGAFTVSIGNGFLLLPIYFFIAQARVYPQKRWKLWLRSGLLFFFYSLLLALIVTFTIVLGVLLL